MQLSFAFWIVLLGPLVLLLQAAHPPSPPGVFCPPAHFADCWNARHFSKLCCQNIHRCLLQGNSHAQALFPKLIIGLQRLSI